MRARQLWRGTILVVPALLVLMFGAAPGMAHHKDGHDGGPQKDKGGSSATVTEDNDDNDGGTPNNQADEGDNKHPSGKDRSEEKGNSGNQGNSPSDPDGDSNGGPDKPGGSGGVDLADQDGNNGCGNDDDFEDDNNGNCGGRKDEVKDTKAECVAGMSKNHGKKCDTATAGEEDATCPEATDMPSDEGGCGDTDVHADEDDALCLDDSSMTQGEECGGLDSEDQSPLAGGLTAGADVLGEVITRGGNGTSTTSAPSVADDTLVAGAAERPATMPFTGADVLTILAAGLGLLATGFFVLRFSRD